MQKPIAVRKGLEIFEKYGNDVGIAAEHDIIYAGPYDCILVNEEDTKTLASLGWFIDKSCDSWAIFV